MVGVSVFGKCFGAAMRGTWEGGAGMRAARNLEKGAGMRAARNLKRGCMNESSKELGKGV